MSFPVLDFVGTFVGKKPNYPLVRTHNWNTDEVMYDSGFVQDNELYKYPIRQWELHHQHLTEAHRNKLVELFNAARGRGRSLYLIDPLDYQATCTWTQPTYSIGAVDQDDDYFRISGQHASDFQVDWTFKVTGSTGNDGVYTVKDVSQDDNYTYIYVDEEIPDSTGDGSILLMYFQLYKTYYSGEDYEFSEPKKDIQPGQCTVEVNSVEQTEGVDYTLTDTEGVIMFTSASTPTAGQTIEAVFDFYYRVKYATDTFQDTRICYEHYGADVITLVERKRRTTEL